MATMVTEREFPTRRKAQIWLRGQGFLPCRPDPVKAKILAYWKMSAFARLTQTGRTYNGQTLVTVEEVR
jgi:hypothetical protein